MALSGSTVWEVRTAGANTNGGGFVTGASGTDFSQQDAAQFALTGLTSSGSGNVVLSASAAATMVGNIAQVISGTNFTAGFFQITSVSAGVSITFSTNSAGTAICTGVGASGVINIGGALLGPGVAASNMVVNGMIMYVKAGTGYTITSATQNIAGGTVKLNAAGVALGMYGYTTTRGDNGQATLTLNAAVSSATFITGNCFGTIENFILDGASQTSSAGVNGTSGSGYTWQKIKIMNCTGLAFAAGNVPNFFVNCQATTCSGVAFTGVSGSAFGCECYSNTATAFNNMVCYSCMAYNNTGGSTDGFTGATAVNCIAYGNGRHGFSSNGIAYINCHAENNVSFGFVMTGARTWILSNCTAYNNSGGNLSAASGSPPQQTVTVLSSSAFVNAAGGNFALNNTVGGGASLRAAGLPGVFPAGLTTSYLDIGAAQHQDTPATNLFIVQD